MVKRTDRPRSPEIDGAIREALGGVVAPPGLRERVRAALDEEDARRAGGAGTRTISGRRTRPGRLVLENAL